MKGKGKEKERERERRKNYEREGEEDAMTEEMRKEEEEEGNREDEKREEQGRLGDSKTAGAEGSETPPGALPAWTPAPPAPRPRTSQCQGPPRRSPGELGPPGWAGPAGVGPLSPMGHHRLWGEGENRAGWGAPVAARPCSGGLGFLCHGVGDAGLKPPSAWRTSSSCSVLPRGTDRRRDLREQHRGQTLAGRLGAPLSAPTAICSPSP